MIGGELTTSDTGTLQGNKREMNTRQEDLPKISGLLGSL